MATMIGSQLHVFRDADGKGIAADVGVLNEPIQQALRRSDLPAEVDDLVKKYGVVLGYASGLVKTSVRVTDAWHFTPPAGPTWHKDGFIPRDFNLRPNVIAFAFTAHDRPAEARRDGTGFTLNHLAIAELQNIFTAEFLELLAVMYGRAESCKKRDRCASYAANVIFEIDGLRQDIKDNRLHSIDYQLDKMTGAMRELINGLFRWK